MTKQTKDLFAKYDWAVAKAQSQLKKKLIKRIQSLLAIAKDDGIFYVCTGMGCCSLSSDRFKVIYSDEPDKIVTIGDDFEIGEKLTEGKYNMVVECSTPTRKALIEVHEICEELLSQSLWVFPFKIFADKIEH